MCRVVSCSFAHIYFPTFMQRHKIVSERVSVANDVEKNICRTHNSSYTTISCGVLGTCVIVITALVAPRSVVGSHTSIASLSCLTHVFSPWDTTA